MSEVWSEAAPRARRHPERIGAYHIQGVLGRGGMGVVFDARAPGGPPVALKIVRHTGDASRRDVTRARFEREARILGGLSHPSVVRLVDAGETDGVLFLAMERIDGVSLLAVRRRGPLELEPLANIGFQLADALAHVHDAGVVHRDIKPANVLIRPDGRPVITDFGISGLSHATGITRHGDLLGSPGFMAPEIVNGHGPSPASDQFALGRLLFELGARGAAPKLPSGVPLLEVLQRALEVDWTRFPTDGRWPELARVLDRMLEPEPEDRFPSAALVRAAIASVLDDALAPETVSAHVEGLDIRGDGAWTLEAAPHDILSELDLPAGEAARAGPAELPLDAIVEPPARGPAEPDDDGAPHPGPAPGAGETQGARTVLTDGPGEVRSEDEEDADTHLEERPPDPEPPALEPPDPEPAAPPHPRRLTLPPVGGAGRRAKPPSTLGDPSSAPRAPTPGGRPEARPPLGEPAAPGSAALRTGSRETPLEAPAALHPGSRETPLDAPETTAARRDKLPEARERRALAPETSASPHAARRLQREREAAKARSPRPRALLTFIAAGVALLVGAAIGRWSAPPAALPDLHLALVPPRRPAELALPSGGARDARPNPDDVRYATSLFTVALEQARAGQLDAAESSLALCVEVAGLPACHRLRGTLFALRGDTGAAQASFSRYLEVAPEAPDASSIRAILDP